MSHLIMAQSRLCIPDWGGGGAHFVGTEKNYGHKPMVILEFCKKLTKQLLDNT